MKHIALVALLLALTTAGPLRAGSPLGTAFTYQGVLTEADGPASGSYDFSFTLFDAPSDGVPLAAAFLLPGCAVSNGLFQVVLDFGVGVFGGEARWLELAVRTNGAAVFTLLSPRQPLLPSPYALYAPSAGVAAGLSRVLPEGQLPPSVARLDLNQSFTGANQMLHPGNVFAGQGAGLTGLNASELVSGLVADERLSANVPLLGSSPAFAGTVSAGTDLLAAGDVRGRRLNIGTGHTLSGALATIAGGTGHVNQGAHAAIGGGVSNVVQAGSSAPVIGGGQYNQIEVGAHQGTIGGGYSNWVQANAGMSTIAGGNANRIESGAMDSTVGGGFDNIVRSNRLGATISGGGLNRVDASYGAIPGGTDNLVAGDYGFAAGHQAKALHPGTFVWADSTPAPFASTANDQFLVRATGGVGIGGPPGAGLALDVWGNLRANSFSGSGAGLTLLDAGAITTGLLGDARLPGGIARDAEVFGLVLGSDGAGSGLDADLLDGQQASAFAAAAHLHDATYWRLQGNNIVAGNFLGTLNNFPLELRANNAAALRLEPNATSPNFVGGFGGNAATPGVAGAVIGGGGRATAENKVTLDFGVVGGGLSNVAGGMYSSIGGGATNLVAGLGGSADPQAKYAVIGGGWGNVVHDWASTVGGGGWNSILPGAYQATIAGGYGNRIESRYSTVGGGTQNHIVLPESYAATVSGGFGNQVTNAYGSVVAGGMGNVVWDFANGAAIGGGFDNQIMQRANHATVGGGQGNAIAMEGAHSVIAGGQSNRIEVDGHLATIAGGQGNIVGTGADYGAISGGRENVVQGGYSGAVGGGWKNLVGADDAVISGGNKNTNLALRGTISGGLENLIHSGAYDATVAGGAHHRVGPTAPYAAISGGLQNTVAANASYATIPGGRENQAAGPYSLAAGRRAKAIHQGTLVWADSQDADFTSTGVNQFLVRAAGGLGINKNNPAAALDVNGTVRATAFVGDGSGLTGITATVPDGSITTAKLADSAVTSAKIADGAVNSADILDATIATTDLASSAVSTVKLADGAVTSAKLADGTVASLDLASDAASLSKVSGGSLSSSGGHLSASGNLTVAGTVASVQASQMQINPLAAKTVDAGVSLSAIPDHYGALLVSATVAGTYRLIVPVDVPLQVFGRRPTAWSVTTHYSHASLGNYITRTRVFCTHVAESGYYTEDTTDRTSATHANYLVNGPLHFNEDWRTKTIEYQVTLQAGGSLRIGGVLLHYTY